MDREAFGERIQQYLRASGHSQAELADMLGLHPKVLSRKLNGSGNASLTKDEVLNTILTLVNWRVLTTMSEVQKLLELAPLKQSSNMEILSRLKDVYEQPLSSDERSKLLIETTATLRIR